MGIYHCVLRFNLTPEELERSTELDKYFIAQCTFVTEPDSKRKYSLHHVAQKSSVSDDDGKPKIVLHSENKSLKHQDFLKFARSYARLVPGTLVVEGAPQLEGELILEYQLTQKGLAALLRKYAGSYISVDPDVTRYENVPAELIDRFSADPERIRYC